MFVSCSLHENAQFAALFIDPRAEWSTAQGMYMVTISRLSPREVDGRWYANACPQQRELAPPFIWLCKACASLCVQSSPSRLAAIGTTLHGSHTLDCFGGSSLAKLPVCFQDRHVRQGEGLPIQVKATNASSLS